MDSKLFTIGVLSVTATILFAALIIVFVLPAPTLASGGMTVTGGEYIMTVGKDAGDQEFLYVIDTVKDRLIVYRFDGGRNQIVLSQGMELSELRGPQNNSGNRRGGYRGRP